MRDRNAYHAAWYRQNKERIREQREKRQQERFESTFDTTAEAGHPGVILDVLPPEEEGWIFFLAQQEGD